MLACPCNLGAPLKTYFYSIKLRFTGAHIIFLILRALSIGIKKAVLTSIYNLYFTHEHPKRYFHSWLRHPLKYSFWCSFDVLKIHLTPKKSNILYMFCKKIRKMLLFFYLKTVFFTAEKSQYCIGAFHIMPTRNLWNLMCSHSVGLYA